MLKNIKAQAALQFRCTLFTVPVYPFDTSGVPPPISQQTSKVKDVGSKVKNLDTFDLCVTLAGSKIFQLLTLSILFLTLHSLPLSFQMDLDQHLGSKINFLVN